MVKREVVVAAAATTATVTMAGLALFFRHWKRRSHQQLSAKRILREFTRQCATPSSLLWRVANELASDMEAELSPGKKGGNPGLGMPVCYLAPLPTGEEKGIYYGINLRGTNFLMVRAKLEGRNEPLTDLLREEVAVPSHILSSADSTSELCDLMALELVKFVSLHSETDSYTTGAKERMLGFTVSFPADQVQPSSAIDSKWKRPSVDDTVGKELTEEINQALKKHSVDMRVFAVVNDTIGHLAGGRYYSKECVAAVSLGMGTDVAYIEPSQQIPNLLNESSDSAETAINMQWGNFSSSHLPLTEYDASLDAESVDPGRRIFEKLISGMYLGEIVRRVLLKMAEESALLGESVPPKVAIPYSLRSPDMAAMHQDISEDYEVVDEKLTEIFDIESCSPMMREMIREICDVVVERGARLVGAGIVGIVKKMGRVANKKSVITIEGGLYKHYRIYRDYLHNSVLEMLGTDLSDNVIIEHSHGGSGASSIFLAASQTEHS